MFHSVVTLGQAKLPLEELLEKCRTGGDIPITDGTGKRGIGGFIRVFASLRSPIKSPNGEVRVSTERELIIGPWPEFTPPTASTASVASQQSTKTVDFSCLSEEEKRDPLSVKWLESSEVLMKEKEFLQAEEEKATAALNNLRSSKMKSADVAEQMEKMEMEIDHLQDNHMLVENKLMILGLKVSLLALASDTHVLLWLQALTILLLCGLYRFRKEC
jgi:hypothetical protein